VCTSFGHICTGECSTAVQAAQVEGTREEVAYLEGTVGYEVWN